MGDDRVIVPGASLSRVGKEKEIQVGVAKVWMSQMCSSNVQRLVPTAFLPELLPRHFILATGSVGPQANPFIPVAELQDKVGSLLHPKVTRQGTRDANHSWAVPLPVSSSPSQPAPLWHQKPNPACCLPQLAVVGSPTVPSAFPSRQPDGSNESAASGLVKGIPPL